MFGDDHDDDRNERILERVFEGQMFWAAEIIDRLTHEIEESEERTMAQVDQEGQDIIAAINDAGTELDTLEQEIATLEAASAANAQASVDLTAVKASASALRAKLTAIGSAVGAGTGTGTSPAPGDTGTGTGATAPGDGTGAATGATGATGAGDGTTAPGDGTTATPV